MRKKTVAGLLLIPVVALVIIAAERGRHFKEPAVAGAFYPATKGELKRTVDSLLAGVTVPQAGGRLLGLIAPHAGYQYSGGVAAEAYARLKGSGISTVILVGPSHQARLRGAAVLVEGGMRTPLGAVRIDERLAASLVNEQDGISASTTPFAREHSLEVQLPFLQRVLDDFTIVPILIGTPTHASLATLAEKLAAILKDDPHAIIVASTDLSHYHDATTARRMDDRVLGEVSRMAIRDLERSLASGDGEMCGGYPVLVTLAALKKVGANNVVLYRQADSGDITGNKREVVGYAAMGIYRNALSGDERARLLALAQETLTAHLTGGKLPDASGVPRLMTDGASFVTLKDRHGRLRGCIGTIQPVMPLDRSVITNAVSAASRDPRFPPVTAKELPGLSVEVTVLSPLEPLTDTHAIVIGQHGLYLERAGASSVLLPQVPVEFGWDSATYLKELARKAGLPDDGWKGARLYSFTADVIN